VVQLMLLRSLQGIASSVKFKSLSPIVIAMIEGDKPHLDDELVSLLLASADETSAIAFNKPESSVWATYTSVLRHYFRSGTVNTAIQHLSLKYFLGMSSSARSTIGHGLRSGLFSNLTIGRKVEVCRVLVDIGCQSPDTVCAALFN
jgi:U3 small nucleolar RNA-associated protein 10